VNRGAAQRQVWNLSPGIYEGGVFFQGQPDCSMDLPEFPQEHCAHSEQAGGKQR
jgi:hypothetical protein